MINLQSPSSHTNVLVVDDERTTRLAVAEALTQLGYHCQVAGSGEEAIHILAQSTFQVAILDLEMPGLKGTDVLQAADKIAPQTAFIILTAHASTDTAITALRSGAVDYLRKPSSLQVIATAVADAAEKQQQTSRQKKALGLLQQAMDTLNDPQLESLSPSPSSPPAPMSSSIQVGEVELNTQTQTAFYKQQPLDLTPIEYRLLHHLITHPDEICTYSQLGVASHEVEMDEVEARALLRTHMYRLGRKFGEKENSPLQSVWGRGFVLQSH